MVTLVILDGFGHRNERYGNAIKLAGTPFLDSLKKSYPHMLLNASGKAVGLSENQMGNSEVGHLTIGSGRILLQDLEKINAEIKSGEFFENKEFNNAMNFAKGNNGAIHLIGLLSDGGVHSHINHLKALIKLTQKHNLEKVYIHAITDGRDTPIDSGRSYIRNIQEFCKGTSAEIVDICGRFYAMDREERYGNTKKYYDMLVFGRTETQNNGNPHKDNFVDENKESKTPKSNFADDVFRESYSRGFFDEFIEPTIIGSPKVINEGDAVIFFNFRSDRARQLADAFSNPDFPYFETKKFKNVFFVSMSEYSNNLKNVKVAYSNKNIKNTLAEVISKNGKKQFHIAETTKYAHVTFFFNGGREEPFNDEERCLIPTLADSDFTKNPQMRAFEITEKTKEIILKNKYDFILVNLSNPDMLGHTANIEATKKAITCVDKCAYEIAMACVSVGGSCIITADHGNAEMLIDKNGKPHTTHTTNPVPFILVAETQEKSKNQNQTQKFKKSENSKILYKLKKNGGLANIASTVLDLLNLQPSLEMSNSLIENSD
jgi:2,3-bisphosphoglycerate-independent phosphoglycerate mutase